MKFEKKSSRTTPSSPWRKSMTNWMKPHSTSNATRSTSNQSLHSPTLQSHSDMKLVSESEIALSESELPVSSIAACSVTAAGAPGAVLCSPSGDEVVLVQNDVAGQLDVHVGAHDTVEIDIQVGLAVLRRRVVRIRSRQIAQFVLYIRGRGRGKSRIDFRNY